MNDRVLLTESTGQSMWAALGVDQVVHVDAVDLHFAADAPVDRVILTWRGTLDATRISVYAADAPPPFVDLIGVSRVACGMTLDIRPDNGLYRVRYVPYHPE